MEGDCKDDSDDNRTNKSVELLLRYELPAIQLCQLTPYKTTQQHTSAANAPRDQVWGWDTANNLQVVVALIFTSTCGVLEGANLSGDLKDPAASLPKGTLFAQLTAFTTYLIFAILMAAS